MQATIKYETPLGSFETWEAAAAACERADLDPCTCISNQRVGPGPSLVSYEVMPDGSAPVRLSFQIKCF